MSKIYFKGNMPAMDVSAAEAQLAQSAFESGRAGAVIKIRNLTFKATEIKGISFDEQSSDTGIFDNVALWHNQRREFAKRTPESKTTSFLSGPAYLITNIAPEIDMDILKERILKFFQENPKRCYPNVSVFNGLWHKHNLHPAEEAGIRILGNTIGADVSAVEEDEKYKKSLLVQDSMQDTGWL